MRKGSKKRDNRGLTLVELIVAISISTILIGAAWQFVLTGTKSYNSQKSKVDMQMEVQQTMNQIENLVVDANRSIAYLVDATETGNDAQVDESILESASTKTINIYGTEKISQIVWQKDEQQVVYKELLVNNVSEEEPEVVEDEEETAILAENVTAFEADLTKINTNSVVTLKLTFEKNSDIYEAERNITLRNTVMNTANTDEIYNNEDEQLPISITIECKKNLEKDEETQIEKMNQRDTAEFVATVLGTDDKDVIWSVKGNTSAGTTIDVKTGKLTIDASEEKGNQITIIASLESNRSLKGLKKILVEEVRPSIQLQIADNNPWILAGTSYDTSNKDCPIQVKIANANEERYTLKAYKEYPTETSALEFEGVQTRNQVHLDVLATQEYSAVTNACVFYLQAELNENPEIKSNIIEMKIRKPEFDIQVSTEDGDTTQTVFKRGQELVLSADWTKSTEAQADINGLAKPLYTKRIMDASKLTWAINYIDSNGETRTTLVGEDITTVSGLKIPEDISNDVNQVTLYAQSNTFGSDVYALRTIKVEPVQISFGKVVVIKDSKEVNVTENTVNRGDTVEFTIAVEGFDNNIKSNIKLDWELSPAEPLEFQLANRGQKNTITVFDTNMSQDEATYTVTVTEPYTYVKASYIFKVSAYKECTEELTEIKYLYSKSSSANINNTFSIPAVGYQSVIEKEKIDTNIVSTDADKTFAEAILVDKQSSQILFTPYATNLTMQDGSYFDYHLDNKYTGDHIAGARLKAYMADFEYSRGGFLGFLGKTKGYIYVPYETKNAVKSLVDSAPNKSFTETFEFANYYGEGNTSGTPHVYTCQYYSARSWGSTKYYVKIYDVTGNLELADMELE